MRKQTIVTILFLLIFTMACSLTELINGNPNPESETNLAATVSALETQLAEEPEEPTTEPTVIPTDTPEPTPAPDFEFQNISFDYHPSLSTNVWGEIIPEYVPGEDEIYAFAEPEHILVHFDNYIIGDHFHTPEIRVFPAARYRELSDGAAYNLDLLATVLDQQLREEETYPLLPLVPAAQILTAKVDFIQFDGGRGVRYLTQLGQALYPANNQMIFYSFQGITDDGAYFISAILPIRHPELLNNGDDVGNDWEPYYSEEAWDEYKTQTEAELDGYPEDSFAPSMILLDDIFRSLRISP